MYTLTLTHSERQAIDWVGNRYATGDEFSNYLHDTQVHWNTLIGNIRINDDDHWNSAFDIKFHIPEHIAWEICDLFETEELAFPCFSDEFKVKLVKWMDQII